MMSVKMNQKEQRFIVLKHAQEILLSNSFGNVLRMYIK